MQHTTHRVPEHVRYRMHEITPEAGTKYHTRSDTAFQVKLPDNIHNGLQSAYKKAVHGSDY